METRRRVSVFLPAYNEVDNLERSVADIVWAAEYVPQAKAYLHKTTAERLGQVSTALEGQMPITYVGQDLRDRYHNRTSRSLMAHPMGYAVDFRAMDNPQIHGDKGKVIRKLIELMSKMEGNDKLEALLGEIIGNTDKASALAQELGMVTPTSPDTTTPEGE